MKTVMARLIGAGLAILLVCGGAWTGSVEAGQAGKAAGQRLGEAFKDDF